METHPPHSVDIAVFDHAQSLRASRKYFRSPLPQHLAASAGLLNGSPFSGVAYQGGLLLFDRSVHTEETADLLLRHFQGEALAATFQSKGARVETTSEDLKIINERHAPEPLKASDVAVFQEYAASDQRMRRPLRLTRRALGKMAADYEEGRTLLLDHDQARPVGRTFAADVVEETVRGVKGSWLRVRWYTALEGASEERLQDLSDVRSGVRAYVSAGLQGGVWTAQEVEVDGRRDFFFEIDDDPEEAPRLEAVELSKVYLGAVVGAGNSKFQADETESEPESLAAISDRQSEKTQLICVL